MFAVRVNIVHFVFVDSDSDNDIVNASPRYNPMNVPLLDSTNDMFSGGSPATLSSSDHEDTYRKFQHLYSLEEACVQHNHLDSTNDTPIKEEEGTQMFQRQLSKSLPMPPSENTYNVPQQLPCHV